MSQSNTFSEQADLFNRVAKILQQARTHVARSVNQTMVTAYWAIGREIVEALQGGDARADYGKALLKNLSEQMVRQFGRGYSTTNLERFRKFYLLYSDRITSTNNVDIIVTTVMAQSVHPDADVIPANSLPELQQHEKGLLSTQLVGFHPDLNWSHYVALMRVQKRSARDFYESESVAANWTAEELTRQIHSLYYERLLLSHDKRSMLQENRRPTDDRSPLAVLKDPYVFEFLDLPESTTLREKDLENAIIDKLERFLLELGRGFTFVARQKRLTFDDADFFVDLVFYNVQLKCYVLIDLKMDKLTHQDIGQMDSYVRMYEDKFKGADDNPTIGLIMCSDKNNAIVRYSVLHESEQLFASLYRLTLPSEEELGMALQREREALEKQRLRTEPFDK